MNDERDQQADSDVYAGAADLAKAEHEALFAIRRLRIVQGDGMDGYEPVAATPEQALMSIGQLYGPELRALLTELEGIGDLPPDAERLRAAVWPFLKAYDVMGTLGDDGL